MLRFEFLIVASLLIAVTVSGCDQNKTDVAKEPAAAKSTDTAAKPSDADIKDLNEFLKKDQQPAAGGTAALPPGHPPLDGSAPAQAGGGMPAGHPPVDGATPAAAKGTLKYDAPADWKSEQVRSSMRLAQYLIPRAEGDAQDGQMIVFHFGPGQGGPTDMNIARWKAMFTGKDGQPAGDDVAKVEKRQVAGLNVTTLDVSGIYNDPMMMQSGGAKIDGEARMLAAVVETPGGSYFLKAVGPLKTMSVQTESFSKLVESIRME